MTTDHQGVSWKYGRIVEIRSRLKCDRVEILIVVVNDQVEITRSGMGRDPTIKGSSGRWGRRDKGVKGRE
jgi:hypothetical protein